MTGKKRPSLIVMKRLDTMGLRLLSQAVGAGTRRAGVRLSPRGELTPHHRGEPISSAPPPAGADANQAPASRRELSVETPAILDTTGTLSAEIRERASAQLALRIAEGRAREEDGAPDSTDASPTCATATSAAPASADETRGLASHDSPSRRSTMAWGAALLVAGAVTGVLIARVVGGPPLERAARAPVTVGVAAETTPAAAPQAEPSLGANGASPTSPALAPSHDRGGDPIVTGQGGEARVTRPGPQLETGRAAD